MLGLIITSLSASYNLAMVGWELSNSTNPVAIAGNATIVVAEKLVPACVKYPAYGFAFVAASGLHLVPGCTGPTFAIQCKIAKRVIAPPC
jgi:hypothetical protein